MAGGRVAHGSGVAVGADRHHHREGVGPIPATTARKLLQDASIALLVRDGDEVRAVGRPVRTIPAKLRRELTTTYPVCEGGDTSRTNTWRICPHHHFLKHHRGWRVTGEPSHWDLVPPTDPRGPPAT